MTCDLSVEDIKAASVEGRDPAGRDLDRRIGARSERAPLGAMLTTRRTPCCSGVRTDAAQRRARQIDIDLTLSK
jgi:hypothetical protein